jgi:hypothetical protein
MAEHESQCPIKNGGVHPHTKKQRLSHKDRKLLTVEQQLEADAEQARRAVARRAPRVTPNGFFDSAKHTAVACASLNRALKSTDLVKSYHDARLGHPKKLQSDGWVVDYIADKSTQYVSFNLLYVVTAKK